MLLQLWSAYPSTKGESKQSIKLNDEEAPRTNGNSRIPNAADRQAADAQEFELEGLMSDDEEPEAAKMNGKPRAP